MFRRFAPVVSKAGFHATCPMTLFTSRFSCSSFGGVATIRQKAPEWTAKAVVNGAIKEVSLADYAGKYLVMVFYPLDFTFVCPTEIISFSERAEEFEKIGAQVVVLSVDSAYSHLAWSSIPRKKGGVGELKIPMISDITKDISRDYGVLIEDEGIAFRGLFIIDKESKVRSITINDLPVGRDVDETLRVVQAFKYSDENAGEVVPCGWRPGKETLKVGKAATYFENNY
eukprot:Tbor_TRINITY_DN5190_c0_g1::TRINITY_DN5190_c0_g1_i2::g.25800::m.25800/K03386/PRDX2_4, ahpC; peroxiredoxin (alkyl hydroperoxide reductase subunit C)